MDGARHQFLAGAAFSVLVFLVVHLYMTTTGHSILAHIKAMFTGREEVEKGETVEDW